MPRLWAGRADYPTLPHKRGTVAFRAPTAPYNLLPARPARPAPPAGANIWTRINPKCVVQSYSTENICNPLQPFSPGTTIACT